MRALEVAIKELYQYTDVYDANNVFYQPLIGKGLDEQFDRREIVKRLRK